MPDEVTPVELAPSLEPPTFDTMDELWLAAAQAIRDHGHSIPSRDGPCDEIMGFCARLSNPFAHFMFNPHRKMSPSYAAAELLWYLSGSHDITTMLFYAPQYKRFVEGWGDHPPYSYGAYGGRLNDVEPCLQAEFNIGEKERKLGRASSFKWKQHQHYHGTAKRPSQIDYLLHLLSCKPDTRQAVITLYQPRDLVHGISGDKNDIPCTLSLNFLVRGRKLYLTTTMRSNDIWLGLPYDAFCFTSLQILVAQALRLEVGWYQHQAMSLHMYHRNSDKFELAANPPGFDVGAMIYERTEKPFNLIVQQAVELEKHNREQVKTCTTQTMEVHDKTLLGQCLIMAGLKVRPHAKIAKRLNNSLMQKYALTYFVESDDDDQTLTT